MLRGGVCRQRAPSPVRHRRLRSLEGVLTLSSAPGPAWDGGTPFTPKGRGAAGGQSPAQTQPLLLGQPTERRPGRQRHGSRCRPRQTRLREERFGHGLGIFGHPGASLSVRTHPRLDPAVNLMPLGCSTLPARRLEFPAADTRAGIARPPGQHQTCRVPRHRNPTTRDGGGDPAALLPALPAQGGKAWGAEGLSGASHPTLCTPGVWRVKKGLLSCSPTPFFSPPSLPAKPRPCLLLL